MSEKHRETAGQLTMFEEPGESGNVFRRGRKTDQHRELLRRHKAWLELIRHEYPLPEKQYRIGVYIRYFNQTKYDNYLDFHKKEFEDTIGLCPLWTLVDFYVDEGASAPNMESAKGWCRLLNDCLEGKVDLIITQKVSNVSRKPEELALIARLLACQEHPVGMYFINEDLFTLASYYQQQMRDPDFLGKGPGLELDRITDGEIYADTDE